MANSFTQPAACPLCHNTATVKRVASLYENPRYQRDARFAPPKRVAEKQFLLKPITISVFIETITLVAIMIVCASNTFSLEQYLFSVVAICIPLVWSGYAFFRMVRTESRSQAQLDWDQALATWSQLDYCIADDLVFNPTVTETTAPAHSISQEQTYGEIPVFTHAA